MKKNIKLWILLFLLFPAGVFADTVNVSCSATKIKPNDTVNCSITGTTSSAISSLSAKLNATGNIKISNIKTSSIWQGDGADGSIELYTDSNKTNTFNIATFQVTGTKVGTGSIAINNTVFYDSQFQEINVGNKTLNITVEQAQTNNNTNPETTQKKDATLKKLTITPGVLNFSKTIYTYNVIVDSSVTDVKIEAAPSDSTSKVSIPKDLSLKDGTTTFKVVVTATDKTTKTYTINVTKNIEEKSSNTEISSMLITGEDEFKFEKGKHEYTITTDKTMLPINISLVDSKATYEVIGNSNLKNNDIITIKVVAEDGTTDEYKIKILTEKKAVEKEKTSLKIPTIIFIISEILWIALLVLYLKVFKNL